MCRPKADLAVVDLTNCDKEPIHILGTIQSFGFLVAVSTDWQIQHVSANIEQFLGVSPSDLIGTPLGDHFQPDAIHALRNRLSMLRGPDAIERLFDVALIPNRFFDIGVHFSGRALVIEAEPSSHSEIDVASLVRGMIARARQMDTLASFLNIGTRQVRAITGFDRVMVYRFDREGSGEVVAESHGQGIDSFLGLHYPASDIPAQARALYLASTFRIIADVQAMPVPIIPAVDESGVALDQSLCLLRAVSPIHIEYLNNMGVRASLSISLVVEGKLWGLIACHHYSPRLPSFAQRSALELFGQMYSMMLESRVRAQVAEYEARARMLSDRIMAAAARDQSLLENAEWLSEVIFDLIPADGVGVRIGDKLVFSGQTPDENQFLELLAALDADYPKKIFSTDCISTFLPSAEVFASHAAGMIVIPLSRAARNYMIVFRAEQIRSVRWAGNPEKNVEYGPNGPRLSPRKSFDEWCQVVKGKCLPFTDAELRVAETVRVAFQEVVLRLSEITMQERVAADDRRKFLIKELNHRIRNILALIRALVSQTRQSADTTEMFFESLDDRIKALARAHDLVTAENRQPSPLIDLLRTEAAAYLADRSDRVALEGPAILLAPEAYTVLSLVFHELITNSVKYGALSNIGSVEVSWSLTDAGNLNILWAEHGGPAVTPPKRRGFGSEIIERAIPHDLAGTAKIDYAKAGVRAQFELPKGYIRGLQPTRTGPATAHRKIDSSTVLHEKTVFLVEDSLIVALDLEQSLRGMGATNVVTAASVPRALALIQNTHMDLAILDFRLGNDTTENIASILMSKNIPCLFSSGYGNDLPVDQKFSHIPRLEKPFDMQQLAAALLQILHPENPVQEEDITV